MRQVKIQNVGGEDLAVVFGGPNPQEKQTIHPGTETAILQLQPGQTVSVEEVKEDAPAPAASTASTAGGVNKPK